jgi:hypothetical protein
LSVDALSETGKLVQIKYEQKKQEKQGAAYTAVVQKREMNQDSSTPISFDFSEFERKMERMFEQKLSSFVEHLPVRTVEQSYCKTSEQFERVGVEKREQSLFSGNNRSVSSLPAAELEDTVSTFRNEQEDIKPDRIALPRKSAFVQPVVESNKSMDGLSFESVLPELRKKCAMSSQKFQSLQELSRRLSDNNCSQPDLLEFLKLLQEMVQKLKGRKITDGINVLCATGQQKSGLLQDPMLGFYWMNEFRSIQDSNRA